MLLTFWKPNCLAFIMCIFKMPSSWTFIVYFKNMTKRKIIITTKIGCNLLA
jgi:hypothetical protein